ncbi:hypothetical protein M153_4870005570 [Pseudoloma neurophilia]|uniref:Uncharacterized protein n=1 Tax=Pseudoloma neurophilia TaxID=146866 RepID=A0A0R0M1A9_9MICR|nr:hypothetical protein M153_4870005570 [Pseudoloma neurophilia]
MILQFIPVIKHNFSSYLNKQELKNFRSLKFDILSFISDRYVPFFNIFAKNTFKGIFLTSSAFFLNYFVIEC